MTKEVIGHKIKEVLSLDSISFEKEVSGNYYYNAFKSGGVPQY